MKKRSKKISKKTRLQILLQKRNNFADLSAEDVNLKIANIIRKLHSTVETKKDRLKMELKLDIYRRILEDKLLTKKPICL